MPADSAEEAEFVAGATESRVPTRMAQPLRRVHVALPPASSASLACAGWVMPGCPPAEDQVTIAPHFHWRALRRAPIEDAARENRYGSKAINAVYRSDFVVIETDDFGPDDGCPAAECFDKHLDKKADERLGRGRADDPHDGHVRPAPQQSKRTSLLRGAFEPERRKLPPSRVSPAPWLRYSYSRQMVGTSSPRRYFASARPDLASISTRRPAAPSARGARHRRGANHRFFAGVSTR